MAAPSAPRTITALANIEPAKRSDFAVFAAGVDNIAHQLALVIMGFEDALYPRLAANGGGYSAKAKARIALAPLRGLATAAQALGPAANRAYRTYQRRYADEINPQRRNKKFDHTR
jgi:hypothetical protein